MSDNITELNLIQLKKALQQAAMSADQQIARLKGYDVSFEVADDVYNWSRWALESEKAKLTDEQRSGLIALDTITAEMSGERNAKLWTDDALRSQPEWEKVRLQARKILESFQWPIEDKDDPGIEVI
jgi:hypothetical protein